MLKIRLGLVTIGWDQITIFGLRIFHQLCKSATCINYHLHQATKVWVETKVVLWSTLVRPLYIRDTFIACSLYTCTFQPRNFVEGFACMLSQTLALFGKLALCMLASNAYPYFPWYAFFTIHSTYSPRLDSLFIQLSAFFVKVSTLHYRGTPSVIP